LRPKRKAAQQWQSEKRSTLAGSRRSVNSRQSVASTVFSRASNIIPIAYIPGVTVRSPPQSPGLVPPVPALPGSSPNPGNLPEQHFFMPSDLRASTWSDASSVNNRISLSPSLARTTYYGGDAEVIPPVPAQQAFRAQANMVSVKSGNNTPALNGKSPLVQQVSQMSGSSIVAKTVTARPIEIKKQGSGPRVPTLGNLAKETASKTSKATSISASEKSVPVFFDEKELASPIESEKEVVDDSIRPKPSYATMSTQRSSSISGISRIMPADGPLSSINNHRHSKSEGLNAMIEQALKDATGSHMKRPELKTADSSPFSDAHEIEGKENSPRLS
jgi:protein OPY2